MKTVSVHTAKPYDVLICRGILSSLGEALRRLTKAEKICIISDSNVYPIYGETVVKSIKNASFPYCSFQFPAGENSKNSDNYLRILNFLAENHITRSDCIVALGGGVVGDLAGFAAATYLRGIPYIQVPTTLLAMVDSSVGGKTGIDLPGGKNLCGAFWQPTAVLCDLDTLNTLPEAVFRDGCAEVIKYGILFDPSMITQLEQHTLDFDRETVISCCVQWKRDTVEADERDQGQRMLLNFGHTIGHAIEACSDYTISHGNAVAIGMAMMARATNCPDSGRIIEILQRFGLPVSTDFTAEALYHTALSDKKRISNSINLVIPHRIGHCQITPTSLDAFKTLMEKGS